MAKVAFRHHGRTIRADLAFPTRGRAPFPAILLVHGRGVQRGYPAWMATLQETLVKRGFATLAIDLSGHGKSDGAFEDTTLTKVSQDVRAAGDFLIRHRRVQPMSIGAVGHSLGGIAILVAHVRHPMFKTLVFAAAPLDSKYHLNRSYPPKLRRLWQQEGRLCWWSYSNQATVCMKYAYYQDRRRYDTLAMARQIHQPTLFVHGTADHQVLPIESKRAFKQIDAPTELALIHGANHNFKGRRNGGQVVRRVTAWMAKTLQRRVAHSVIVIVQYRGKILALKRSNLVWYYRGAWAFAGGHLPLGVDPLRHAYTELHEEVGYSANDVRLLKVGSVVRVTDHTTGRTWISTPVLFELKKMKQPRIDWEHTRYTWLKPEKFPLTKSYFGAREHMVALGLV